MAARPHLCLWFSICFLWIEVQLNAVLLYFQIEITRQSVLHGSFIVVDKRCYVTQAETTLVSLFHGIFIELR